MVADGGGWWRVAESAECLLMCLGDVEHRVGMLAVRKPRASTEANAMGVMLLKAS